MGRRDPLPLSGAAAWLECAGTRRGLPARAAGSGAPMTHLMSREELLTLELERLRAEHGDLDAAIEAMQGNPLSDQLSLRRLKKRKLALKDQIARIEDELFPDIIA
tara:strand:- start:225 stop:542 length:318 start_codon:yes stop_codon:yes gene_type:complete